MNAWGAWVHCRYGCNITYFYFISDIVFEIFQIFPLKLKDRKQGQIGFSTYNVLKFENFAPKLKHKISEKYFKMQLFKLLNFPAKTS